MSQPTQYTPTTDFSQQEASNASGRSTVNTAALDTEFANIEETLGQTLDNLKAIQRDDLKLADQIVDVYSLTRDVVNLIGGFRVRGLWEDATEYAVNDIATNDINMYVCVTAHTSGASFDGQYWKQFGYTSGPDAADAAVDAAASAADALASKNAAAASATASAASATASAGSASAASSSATAAANQASAAAASATAAANSVAEIAALESIPDQTGNAGKVLKTDGYVSSWGVALNSGTSINTTSGTAHDFTGIQSWVKRITIMLRGLSTNGTSGVVVRLGTSGGIQTNTYIGGTSGGQSSGSVMIGAWSSGIELVHGAGYTNPGDYVSGSITFNLINQAENAWSVTGTVFRYGSANVYDQIAGMVELTGSVTTIRITTLSGSDIFDAGQINIHYE